MSDYQMTVPMPIEQLQRRIGRAMVDASNLTSEHGDSIFAALNDALDVLVSAKPVRTSVPAETWEPVKNYKHEALNGYTVEVETGNGLQIMNWDLSGAYYAVVDLPDNVRLCRKGG